MQSNRQSTFGDTPDGNPIAIPGTGALGIPTIFAGTAKDMRSADSLLREDERLIVTEFNNVTIDTGKNFPVLDAKEAGELHSIVVVSDNPYLQCFVQIDDFRNQEPNGITVAELLYNGNMVGTSQRRFRAADGQSPSVGYTLVFEPMKPVRYTDRLRIILYNNIPSSTSVYGKGLNFRNSATLPTPAVPAHMAGSTFEQSSLAAVSLSDMAQAMTTPVGSPAYFSGKTYSTASINGSILSGLKLGTDHPYVGIAGRPVFSIDPSAAAIPREKVGSSSRDAGYRLKIRDEAERFPGTVDSYSSMKVDIVCQVGESGVLNGSNAGTHLLTTATYNANLGFGYASDGTNTSVDTTSPNFPVGKRIFYRVGGQIAMLGVCTAVSLTYDNEGTNELVPVGGASVIGNSLTETGASFASKSSSDFKAPSYHLQIEPGLSATSTDFANEVSPSGTLADGFTAASDFACWGTVTSNADTNPQILVKKVDVRRRKVYSKEG
tara:strand:- start:449 stop:1924 length:1476 start_codon:yes stop_codon:yes gene_type:complete